MLDWLDPRGRCNNAEYVRTALECSALAAPLVAVLAIDGVPPPIRLAAIGVLWGLTAIMWLVAIRRAHDEDYAGQEAHWWMGGPTLLLLVWITLPALGVIPNFWFLLACYFAGAFWCYVGLYSVAQAHGSARPNRFGPPTHGRRGKPHGLSASGRS